MALIVEVVTEQDLRDYLCGRLDVERAGAINALLETDPCAQALLRKVALRNTQEAVQPCRRQFASGTEAPARNRWH